MRPLSVVLSALALPACMGHAHIQYVEPATIDLPDLIQVVAPVDRVGSPASNVTLRTFSDTLALSPRVKVMDPQVAQTALKSTPSLVGEPLSGDATRAICEAARASGVVALEDLRNTDDVTVARRTETRTEEEKVTDSNGNTSTRTVERQVEVVDATRTVHVSTAWSTYDCPGHRVDTSEHGASAWASMEGSSDALAIAALPQPGDLVLKAAAAPGAEYARRIAPFPMDADRDYYKGGDKRIKQAHKSLKLDDWDTAKTLWQEVSGAETGKPKGKALFNMAVAAERDGNLEAALELAKQANQVLGNKRSASYLATLKQRKKAEKKLQEQMEGAPG